MQINQLSSVSKLAQGDQLVVFSTQNGDTRKASVATLQAYLQDALSFAGFGAYATQYAAPSATGFSVTLTDGQSDNTNVHLILTPTADFAAGTLTLPPVAGLADKQEVLVNCTHAVTALTIGANGATAVTGAPTALAANDFFRLKYDAPTKTWYRVG